MPVYKQCKIIKYLKVDVYKTLKHITNQTAIINI